MLFISNIVDENVVSFSKVVNNISGEELKGEYIGIKIGECN